MKIDIMDWTGSKKGQAELADDIFGAEPKADVIARVINWQLAKRRAGTHLVKTRSTVSGTTKKPWRQKGTGRARAGSMRGAQWRHGGIIFGPLVRSYAYALNKKIRKLGLKFALAAKARDGKLIVVDTLAVAEAKTKWLASGIAKMNIKAALVIGGNEVDAGFARAAANIVDLDVLPVQGANVYDIMRRDTLVVSADAIDALQARVR
ncbi:50S ribosomal protein L4 [Alphaproteobacteria bacterium]|nr:50S ribosomal protein L4 [Alphaproteobacteria bacterium]